MSIAIPMILAMTAEEIRHAAPLPYTPAFFGCYFTESGSIPLPERLPPGCGLIIDDRFPIPDALSNTITKRLQALSPKYVILDFLRPVHSSAERLIKLLTDLSCSVIIPPQYAGGNDHPVFLPPIPPHILAEEYLEPWHSREIWLELALDASEITITADGCVTHACPHAGNHPDAHSDSMLHCHYKITKGADSIGFYCYRTPDDIAELLCSPLPPNVTHTVGLYQELGK